MTKRKKKRPRPMRCEQAQPYAALRADDRALIRAVAEALRMFADRLSELCSRR